MTASSPWVWVVARIKYVNYGAFDTHSYWRGTYTHNFFSSASSIPRWLGEPIKISWANMLIVWIHKPLNTERDRDTHKHKQKLRKRIFAFVKTKATKLCTYTLMSSLLLALVARSEHRTIFELLYIWISANICIFIGTFEP